MSAIEELKIRMNVLKDLFLRLAGDTIYRQTREEAPGRYTCRARISKDKQ